MQFVDEVSIRVRSGKGGAGSVHFMRQAHRPRMGPDGGDGGRGAHVYFIATRNMQSLLDFRYKHKFYAPDGQGGMGAHKTGKSGEDLYIKVPMGTLIRDAKTGELIADLVVENEEILVAKGGRGGLGNLNFASSTNQTPEYAQPGEMGLEFSIKLELKLMADVGLVGFPNAGKSTLISRVSAAKPKIADYPFTTLVPNLGVVKSRSGSFVVADIPGLIEGAHEGKGLGVQFLKHCERTRLLVILLDGDPLVDRSFQTEFDMLEKELSAFSKKLASKPRIVCLSKADVADPDSLKSRGLSEFSHASECLQISSSSGEGIEEWIQKIDEVLTQMGPRQWENQLGDIERYGKQSLFEEEKGQGEEN